MYKEKRNYLNINKAMFEGCGEYGIPKIQPTQFDLCQFVSFNYAKSCKDRMDLGVHFFIDDYQFERFWNRPDKYIPILQQFKYVMAPDFSLFIDFPKTIQIYNHYRKHWLGAYMQMHDINVIPTVCWGDRSSFDWCFDGEPTNSCVAVSAIGTQMNAISKSLFLDGYRVMVDKLQPSQIIFYGEVPEECENDRIIRVSSFQERFKSL